MLKQYNCPSRTVSTFACSGAASTGEKSLPGSVWAIAAFVSGLALVSALWCRYCAGATDSGAAIAPNDPSWDRLNTVALAAKSDPMAWLSMRDIYGETADHPSFREPFARWLHALDREGTEATLKRYLGLA